MPSFQLVKLFDLPWPPVNAVRLQKLTERDRGLKYVSLKNNLSSVAALTTELQTASGSNVNTRTVRWELHEMGVRAAPHKP